MNPKVSVIIPCYNQGHYLASALANLEKSDNELYEVIIINDGSTDEQTNEICRTLKTEGWHVVFQSNRGLSGQEI